MAAMNAKIRVVIVDDDPLVRAGLSIILGGDPGIEAVGEAADGNDALRRVVELSPDIVLMDIRMPHLDGLAATIEIAKRPSPPKIIVLTTFDADEYVVRALAGGASGFLLKDTPPAQIIDAIRRVAAGEPMLSPSVTEQLIRQVAAKPEDDRAGAAREQVAALTARERDVASAVGRGLSNAEIGADLHMSLATVKAHVSHIFTKLGATNRVQIAIYVHDAGLV